MHGFLLGRCNQLVALATRHALPAMYSYRECAVAGGLMSYDASLTDQTHNTPIVIVQVTACCHESRKAKVALSLRRCVDAKLAQSHPMARVLVGS